jgi:hypothetical protein
MAIPASTVVRKLMAATQKTQSDEHIGRSPAGSSRSWLCWQKDLLPKRRPVGAEQLTVRTHVATSSQS